MKQPTVTLDEVRHALSYNAETGEFLWKNPLGTRVRPGQIAGVIAANGRRYISIHGDLILAHRLAWFYIHGEWPRANVAPKNGDYLDLRLENLVEETAAQTAMKNPLRASNTSGLRGVSWDKSKDKWQATITRNYKQVHLGHYDSKEDAAEAYKKASDNLVALDDAIFAQKKLKEIKNRQWLRAAWKRLESSGVEKGWSDMAFFAASVGEPPSAAHIIVAERGEEPIGPNNFSWVIVEREFNHRDRTDRVEYSRLHRQANPEIYRDKELRRNFGINLDEYKQILDSQNGVCACCGKPETTERGGRVKMLAVDHDHETGINRGLLCQNCNQGIGYFKDDPALLRQAAVYIEHHKALIAEKLAERSSDSSPPLEEAS